MTEKQKYLLKLLQEVDEICREHDLRYVLAGGSLIGALRHEGFVPWDDAIDLYMPRPDWEKFVEICERDLPPVLAGRQTLYQFLFQICIGRYLCDPQKPDCRQRCGGRGDRCIYLGSHPF